MAPTVDRLDPTEHDLVRPLLLELYEYEQPFFSDHPQLSHAELEQTVQRIPTGFKGENVILAVRAPKGLAGFCWCVLFDPGTGMEGEVAELYVAEGHRREGVGRALLEAAIKLFEERGVTLGYVWTRPENDAAVKLYEEVGFSPNRQLVLTWYPNPEGETSRPAGRARQASARPTPSDLEGETSPPTGRARQASARPTPSETGSPSN